MELSAAILAYQRAAQFYGQAQAGTAEASAKYLDAQDTEQAAYRALHTAREELLQAAEQVHLPGSPARPVKDTPQA